MRFTRSIRARCWPTTARRVSTGARRLTKPRSRAFSPKHQRFVGTGYFDQVQQVISGGLSSTVALAGSTETEQFMEKKPLVHPEHGPDAACQPVLGNCPHTPVNIDIGPEEMLLPSG